MIKRISVILSMLMCVVCAFANTSDNISPTSLTFGSQTINTTSAPQYITLRNTGSSNLTFGAETISGPFHWAPATSSTCGASLAPGASCTMGITFTPTAAGTGTGTLSAANNASSSPQTISLSGTGAAAQANTLSPTSLTFGSQTVNTTSAPQYVTFKNTGSANLTFGAETFSGPFHWAPATSSTCGASLAPGASCTMGITFTPTAAGASTGALSVANNANPSPQTVSLTSAGASAVSTSANSSSSGSSSTSSSGSTSTSTSGSSSTNTSAKLLFQSDFGGSVSVSGGANVGSCNSNNGWWPITGGDDGFNWPISINGGSSQGMQPISYGPNISYDSGSQTIKSCSDNGPIWKAEIIQGARHDGTTGPILHRANSQNMYWQFPYIISPGADVPDQYQKVWMKLPSNLASTLGPNSWYTFAEWKTSSSLGTGENYDYRIAIYIYTDSNGTPYWWMAGTEHSGGPYYWTQTNKTTAVPLGQWFQFEWAWHRTHDNSSWTWVKINNTKIMEQDGGGSTCSGCDAVNGFYNSNAPINRIFLGQMYGAQGATEQWTDHVEIWNSVP